MSKLSKQKLLRSTAVVGSAVLALSVPSDAYANTVSNLQILNISSIPNRSNQCSITVQYTTTGVTVDPPSIFDLLAFNLSDSAGNIYPTNSTGEAYAGAPPGTSVTRTATILTSVAAGQHVVPYISFYDVTSNPGAIGPGNLIGQIQIPDAQLQSAGIGCLLLRENNAPSVELRGGGNVTSGQTVVFNNVVSDIDLEPVTVNFTQVSGTPTTINNPTSRAASIVVPAKTAVQQTLVFQISGNDGRTTSSDTETYIIAANQAPSANAGPDANGTGGSLFALNGTGSADPDGDPLTYSWTQTGGPAVTLNGPTSANPSFRPPVNNAVNQIFTFELIVSDGISSSSPDSVTITVPANAPPTADAGNDVTFPGGSQVTLEGAATDAENDPLTYQWTQVAGPSVTLNGSTTLTPSFTAPPKTNAVQILTFSLVANDGTSNSAADTVDVTIPANAGPTPDAGPDAVAGGGTSVALDGTGSTDGDGDPITYNWTQTGGPAVTLIGGTTATPTFTAPTSTTANQVLTFDLQVSDGLIGSRPDTVEITIPANATPMVNAGPDATVSGSSTVNLAGSASDTENDPLTYQWTQVSGPSITLTGGTTLTPSFTAPVKTSVAQILTFSLTANDGTITSAPDTVDITVAANAIEVADAGADQTVSGNAVVTLDATGSNDADGDVLTYSWIQTAGPAVTLNGANTATPTFTAPAGTTANQLLRFEVTVSDGFGSPVEDGVDITVAPNGPPVADAGTDQGPIDSGQTITLDGSASSDPDNDTLTYAWTQVSGTAVTLSDPATATPSFTAPLVNGNENLVFSLTVSDGQVTSSADSVSIAVRAVGTITILQRVVGDDTTVAFTSNVAALNTSVTTSDGNATLSATSVAAGNYTFSVQDLTAQGYALTDLSCNDSDSTVNIASGSIGLALSPSEDLVCTVTLADTRSAASAAIRDFLSGRNALLLSNQPDLQRRIDRLQDGPASGGSASVAGFGVPGSGSLPFAMQSVGGTVSATSSLAMAAGATGDTERKRAVDIWADVTYADVTLGQNQGSFLIGYIGIDYLVTSDILVGALVQIDEFNRDGGVGTPGSVEGKGWMAGPYVTARLSPRLYADARIAYGQSDNSISPIGTFIDGFDTERLLFSGTLVGDVELGGSATIWPELSVRYIRDKQERYVDSMNVTIPGQLVAQGEIAFSPRLDYRIDTRSGWDIRPYAEAEGILTLGAATNTVVNNGFRARLVGGIDAGSPEAVRLNLSGFYDGIGESEFEAAGVSVGISYRF